MTLPGGPAGAARIDAHQHFWRYDAAEYAWIDARMTAIGRDFLPEDLAPPLRAAGFDACVAVQARQSLDETRALLAFADAHPFVAGVVGWVDLQADDAREQLERAAAHPALVGVRHVVQDEPDDRFLLRPAFCRGIGLLREFDLAYDLLIYPRHLPVAAEFVARFPGTRFVLDHLAKPSIRTGEIDRWARDLETLAASPHVVAKLSGLVTEAVWHDWTPRQIRPYLDVAFACFGADRLMIGSDWPVCTLAGDYARVMAVVADYLGERPAADRAQVLGGTAARFWRLRT
jgi:L-fuconolactonase